ncbi:Zinc finger and BTB domain containing protein 11 [Dissostichus eleginoides]|uniref:Zinc finger and BTB domain containing protein 11 n=1 Tax=Dissostichus eleginoides TaxID=100907 RepID=A0AAD9C8I6_DISEL|nr:Zinc finger and BTB domain containing protein 11 [Dissostichus eleginoides]
MSSEESYRAIIRYLTDEREPYAAGTPGNTKRKIRKAATCYVVRSGTLFYQRRLKGQNDFTELEVVLQDGRRRELITEEHVASEGGEHLNQQLTWDSISQKYWWRGILKQVKDVIRECPECLNRRSSDDGAGNRLFARPARRRTTRHKATAKHELVFVDSKGEVNQFLPKHSQTMLDKLNQQRLTNQFCDITLLIEGDEYRAHKAVLAACSEYFNELFFEKGAASTHEAVVDLSASFLPLLDFAYTSTLTFNFCVMADIANLARHLLMTEVLQICESVHKKVEEQKLTVYQRGDVHTVGFVVTIESDGSAVVTQNGVPGEPLAFVSATEEGEQLEAGETMTLISRGAEEGDTMTVVTHSGQAGASESLAVVSACLAMEEEPQNAEATVGFVINVEPDKMSLSEDIKLSSSSPTASPQVVLRPGKRGRPPKHPVDPQQDEGAQCVSEEGAEPQVSATESETPTREPIIEEAGEKEAEPESGGVKPEQKAADGEHSCSECGASFQRRYALIMHTLKHEKARGYKCSLCSKEFQYAASLRAHLARHKQQSSQRAPVIKPPVEPPAERGGGDSDLEDKTQSPNTKREFVCDICGKTLPKLYSLRIHMLNHTGVRPHSCKVCGKTFAHKHSLKMHRALHDVTKQFQCEFCKKSFVSKRSMEEHTSLHTGESKYLCNTCGATFHRASALSKHLKKHQPRPDVRPFACAHCDKRFYEAKDLQQHMNKHMGLKPFQCQVCGKCYSWKKDWYSHVKSHSVAEPFKCNVCGKEFFEKALFRRHVKKATHGKKGRVKQNLERECEQCGRKFTQLREYRRHVNNHQGVKPFECLTCGVAWADARSLKRHVRTHTGERPYVCPMCQEAHIDARTLRKHMAKYHGDNLPGKIMLEKDTLQFHNQGTQVEHAVSILASELPPELRPARQPPAEEIETVLITEETVEAVQAVTDGSLSTLSDQGIMQVVNYVLSQQGLTDPKLEEEEEELEEGGEEEEEVGEVIETMEVEVAHVAEEE